MHATICCSDAGAREEQLLYQADSINQTFVHSIEHTSVYVVWGIIADAGLAPCPKAGSLHGTGFQHLGQVDSWIWLRQL